MGRVKRQHYVPKFYLSAFSSSDGFVSVYDKELNTVFRSKPENVACETSFYDIHVAEDAELDSQVVERYLSLLESDYAALVRSIPERMTEMSKSRLRKWRRVVSREEKERLASFVALQFLRTKEFRIQMSQLRQGLAETIHSVGGTHHSTGFSVSPEGIEYNLEAESLLHARQMLDPGSFDPIRLVLRSHIWVFGLVSGGASLYTSDHPVVRFPHVQHAWMSCAGIGSPGIELAFPLTPSHVLVMYERSYHRKIQRCDCRLVNLSADNCEYYNAQQVVEANRQIYSQDGDFSLAMEVCTTLPQVRQPGRRRLTYN